MSFAIEEAQGFVCITMSGVLTSEDLVALSKAADDIEQGRFDNDEAALSGLRG